MGLPEGGGERGRGKGGGGEEGETSFSIIGEGGGGIERYRVHTRLGHFGGLNPNILYIVQLKKSHPSLKKEVFASGDRKNTFNTF